MVVGETLLKLSGGTYYSPQFNRGGNAAVFPIEVLQLAGGLGLALDVEVEHKNSDDTVWTTLTSFSYIAVGPDASLMGSSIMEQLRFKYIVTGATSADAVCFNMLAPQWRPY